MNDDELLAAGGADDDGEQRPGAPDFGGLGGGGKSPSTGASSKMMTLDDTLPQPTQKLIFVDARRGGRAQRAFESVALDLDTVAARSGGLMLHSPGLRLSPTGEGQRAVGATPPDGSSPTIGNARNPFGVAVAHACCEKLHYRPGTARPLS